jgi:hypothetical protein
VEVLRTNATQDILNDGWRAQLVDMEVGEIPQWIEYGQYLNVLSSISDTQMNAICSTLDADARMQVLFTAERPGLYSPVDDSESEKRVVEAILDLRLLSRRYRSPRGEIERLATAVDLHRFVAGSRTNHPYALRVSWQHYFGDKGDWLDQPFENYTDRPWTEVCSTVSQVSHRLCSEWASNLSLWSTVVEAIRKAYPCAWSAVALACFAAAIPHSSGDGGADLFDADKPLCTRIRAARLKAGQPRWWAETLRTATSPYDIKMAVLTVAVWGSGRTMVAIKEELAAAVSNLASDDRRALYTMVTTIQDHVHTNMTLGRTSPSHAIVEVPAGLAEQVVPLFVSRAKVSTRYEFYSEYLARYRGTEPEILSLAQAIALELMQTPNCNWKRELAMVAYSYAHGALEIGARAHQLEQVSTVPLHVAITIAEAVDAYPSVLVHAAQRSCADIAVKSLAPVAVAARNEGWFVDGR